MNAILLCAGFATRLYPLTRNFPKPLLEVGGKPVIDHLLDQLLTFSGLRSIHLITNARFYEHFTAWAARWQAECRESGISLHVHQDGVHREEERLGAIGDLALLVRRLSPLQPAVVAAGDNIFRFPLQPIWQKFLQSQKNLVIAIREDDIVKLQRTGVLVLGRDDRVMALHEKPHRPPGRWTCPAIYFLQPSALRAVDDYLRERRNPDEPGRFIDYLCRRLPVFAEKVKGERLDIGSLDMLEQARSLLRKEPVLPSE